MLFEVGIRDKIDELKWSVYFDSICVYNIDVFVLLGIAFDSRKDKR